MPDWAPPLIAAGSMLIVLNGALLAVRLRERYRTLRLVRELRRWDGLLPRDLEE